MKQGIHPQYVECTVTCSCGNTFKTHATVSEMKVELCNECHPFYTGQQKFVDTGGRVQRFADKFGGAAAAQLKKAEEAKAAKAAKAAEAEAARKAAAEAKESSLQLNPVLRLSEFSSSFLVADNETLSRFSIFWFIALPYNIIFLILYDVSV